jgi:aldose 1-epimerase
VTHELELRRGAQRVVVTSRGGGIREWQGVLDGYPAGQPARSARGQVLIPWPNRLTDGRYDWDGETYEVPVNDGPYAIHGLVRDVEWEVAGGAAFTYTLEASRGYPSTLRLRIEYALDDDGLTVHCVAENVGTRAAPFGAGFHPYIARHADDVFGAGVQRDDAERFDGSVAIGDVTVWGDEHWKWVQFYTGDDRADVARRSVSVEPMTCRKEAFRTGEDVIRLEPRDVFDARWGIRAEA